MFVEYTVGIPTVFKISYEGFSAELTQFVNLHTKQWIIHNPIGLKAPNWSFITSPPIHLPLQIIHIPLSFPSFRMPHFQSRAHVPGEQYSKRIAQLAHRICKKATDNRTSSFSSLADVEGNGTYSTSVGFRLNWTQRASYRIGVILITISHKTTSPLSRKLRCYHCKCLEESEGHSQACMEIKSRIQFCNWLWYGKWLAYLDYSVVTCKTHFRVWKVFGGRMFMFKLCYWKVSCTWMLNI